MPKFKYTALRQDGSQARGAEEWASKAELERSLKDQGLLLLTAAKISGTKTKRKSSQKVPLDSLILFTRQFATMFRVGMPLLRSLHLLAGQVDNPHLREVVSLIAKDLEDGMALADAFARHPKVFPAIYCNMLAAGEASGNVSVIMEKLCQSMEYESEVKGLVKNALQYPIIVFCALIIAFAVLMGFVVPAFLPLFDQLGGELPLLTKVCVGISTLFTDYWYLLLGGVLALVGVLYALNRTDEGRLILSRAVLRIPLIGPLIIYSFMARFGSMLSILQASGILIVDALRIVGDCIHSRAIRKEIEEVCIDVAAGKSIAMSLEHSMYFPKIMQSMISVGEASGSLDEMMSESARHFELEVRHAVKRLTGALGPILIVCMAVAVGFFAMAIYLPIWEMTELQMAQ
jgi:type IV pilus assembly protein PilC